MFDLRRIEGTTLDEVVQQMSATGLIAEAPSGKIVLVNEQARQLLEQHLGRSILSDPGEIRNFGDLGVFLLDRRPLEREERPLVRAVESGEEVRDEEYAFPLADGTRLTIRCDSSPIYDGGGASSRSC